jgi:uncharacterized coiled-coil DUF342 family protein
MSDPCDQVENIDELKSNHIALHAKTHEMDKKIDILIDNQMRAQENMNKFFSRLEEILIADTEHRQEINQLRKEHDILFEKMRNAHTAHDKVTQFMTECEALEVKPRVQTLWEERSAAVGVKKWKTEIYAVVLFIIGVLTYFDTVGF